MSAGLCLESTAIGETCTNCSGLSIHLKLSRLIGIRLVLRRVQMVQRGPRRSGYQHGSSWIIRLRQSTT